MIFIPLIFSYMNMNRHYIFIRCLSILLDLAKLIEFLELVKLQLTLGMVLTYSSAPSNSKPVDASGSADSILLCMNGYRFSILKTA